MQDSNHEAQKRSDDDDALFANCSTCGASILAIVTTGPSTHNIEPCGHTPTMTTTDSTEIAADGGSPLAQWYDLTGFRRDILRAIYKLEADADATSYGLAIKRELQRRYGTEINHGRLYPNLDILVDKGLVDREELDKRTNAYRLTGTGQDLVDDALTDDVALLDQQYSVDPKPTAVTRGDD